MSETRTDRPSPAPLRGIYPYVPAYLPEMTDLWVASWTLTMPAIDFEARRPWLVEHLGALGDAGVRIEVAIVETGAIAGFVTVDPATGHLDQICVGPDWWGTGIAAALLAAARSIAPGGLQLDVNADNPRAVRFYLAQGFVETARGTNPRSGLPIITM
eukprot:gene42530-52956_t